jgi:pimeloyl-ACP methyl ester carboxylesterase
MSGGPELLTETGLPQELVEYDPEWGRAFASGAVAASCDHHAMLGQVKVPVLYTHHFHEIHPETGRLLGAAADIQVDTARRLIEAAGNSFTYRSFPDMPHSMHGADPELFVATVDEWIRSVAAVGA